MALAINAIDRRGSSNKICCQLQPKQTKIMLYMYYLLYNDKRCYTRHALLARQLCHVGGKWPKKQNTLLVTAMQRRLILTINTRNRKKAFYPLYIITEYKTQSINFKSGCVVRMAKYLKENY